MTILGWQLNTWSDAAFHFVLGYQIVNFRILVVPFKRALGFFFVVANSGYFTVFTPHIYFIILISMIVGNLIEITLSKIPRLYICFTRNKCLLPSVWRPRQLQFFVKVCDKITCLLPQRFLVTPPGENSCLDLCLYTVRTVLEMFRDVHFWTIWQVSTDDLLNNDAISDFVKTGKHVYKK